MLLSKRPDILQSSSTRNRRPKRRSTHKRQIPVTLGIEKLDDRLMLNAAPAITGLSLESTVIYENGWVTLSGSFTDAELQDTHTVLINWGAGEGSSAAVVTQGAGSGTFTATHQYKDDNPTATASDVYTITATVTDNGGGSDTTLPTAEVTGIFTNSAAFASATASLGLPVVIDFEDAPANPFNNTISDRTPFDGSFYGAQGITFSNPNDYPLYIAPGGLFWNPSNSLSVGRFPFDPAAKVFNEDDDLVVTFATPVTAVSFEFVDKGSPLSLEFVQFLDSNGDVIDQVSFSSVGDFVGFVSGVPIKSINIVEAPNDSDDVNYDNFRFFSGVVSPTVTVNNVAPVVTGLSLDSTVINENGSVTVSGSFTDAGIHDTHTVVIDWGTGEGSSAAVVTQGAGSGTFTATHQYKDDNPTATAWDSYTITATVTDDDGGSASGSTTLRVNNVDPVASFLAEANRFELVADQPGGLTFDGTHLFVSNMTGYRTIFVLETDGTLFDSFRAPSTTYAAAGAFDGYGNPNALTFAEGHLFVADLSGKVFEIDAAGTTIFNTFSLPFRPGGMAYDGTHLFISDWDSRTVGVFSTDGTLVRSFTAPQRSAGLTFHDGNLFSIDIFSQTIAEFTTDGTLVGTSDGPQKHVDGLGGITFAGSSMFIAEVSNPDRLNAPPIPGTIIELASNANATLAWTGNDGVPMSLIGSFVDVGSEDTHTFLWQVTASNGDLIAQGTTQNFSFTPPSDGSYTVTFTVTDDDGGVGSDSEVIDVTVGDAGSVNLDVMPGSDSNPVNLRSEGVIPVVILTTANFDASTVDVSTVRFAGASATHFRGQRHARSMEDVDGDGDLDMVLRFELRDTNLLGAYEKLVAADLSDGTLDNTKQTFVATLTGQTTSGVAFKGTDNVDLFVSGRGAKKLGFDDSFDEAAGRDFASTDHWFNRVGTDARVDATHARLRGRSGALNGHRSNDVLHDGADHNALLRGSGSGRTSGGMGGGYADGQGRRRDRVAGGSGDEGGLGDQRIDALNEIEVFFSEFDDVMAALDIL